MLHRSAVRTSVSFQLYHTDCLHFHHCCENDFRMFYFFIGKPGRALLAFQDACKQRFEHHSKLQAPDDSWNR